MKVLYNFTIAEEEKEVLQDLVGPEVEILFTDPEQTSDDELKERIKHARVVVGFHISKQVLMAAKDLTNVIIPFTGIPKGDQHLFKDPELQHITLSNLHFNSDAVAEQAMALLLALTKGIVEYDGALRKGDWSSRYLEVDSFMLKGKTLGIMGLGAIGKAVAIRAKAFGMRLIATKQRLGPGDEAMKGELGIDHLWSKDGKDLLLKGSDILLVSLPSTDDLKGSFGERELSIMGPTSFIINVARGSIIVEKDLYEALRDRKIAGYGADVWFQYPRTRDDWERTLPSKYPFHELDNVVMSPHRSFLIPERETYRSKEIGSEIDLIHRGLAPRNMVDKDKGY